MNFKNESKLSTTDHMKNANWISTSLLSDWQRSNCVKTYYFCDNARKVVILFLLVGGSTGISFKEGYIAISKLRRYIP